MHLLSSQKTIQNDICLHLRGRSIPVLETFVFLWWYALCTCRTILVSHANMQNLTSFLANDVMQTGVLYLSYTTNQTLVFNQCTNVWSQNIHVLTEIWVNMHSGVLFL